MGAPEIPKTKPSLRGMLSGILPVTRNFPDIFYRLDQEVGPVGEVGHPLRRGKLVKALFRITGELIPDGDISGDINFDIPARQGEQLFIDNSIRNVAHASK